MAVKVDKEKCTACGACVECCPTDSLEIEGDCVNVNEDICIDCGVCIDECPTGALEL